MAKQLISGDIKKHLQSQNADHEGDGNSSEVPEGAHVLQDIANIFVTLQKISGD